MTKSKENENEPNAAELRSLADELIKNQSTMTLATSSNGEAWAAPVYYVYHNFSFFFLSNPDSRHIKDALANGQVSAEIHALSFDWREIRGMQMSGKVEHVSSKMEALKAIGAYLMKFPFTKEFFKPGLALDMAAFEKHFRVKLYRLVPSLNYYLDNGIRFGFREEVDFIDR